MWDDSSLFTLIPVLQGPFQRNKLDYCCDKINASCKVDKFIKIMRILCLNLACVLKYFGDDRKWMPPFWYLTYFNTRTRKWKNSLPICMTKTQNTTTWSLYKVPHLRIYAVTIFVRHYSVGCNSSRVQLCEWAATERGGQGCLLGFPNDTAVGWRHIANRRSSRENFIRHVFTLFAANYEGGWRIDLDSDDKVTLWGTTELMYCRWNPISSETVEIARGILGSMLGPYGVINVNEVFLLCLYLLSFWTEFLRRSPHKHDKNVTRETSPTQDIDVWSSIENVPW